MKALYQQIGSLNYTDIFLDKYKFLTFDHKAKMGNMLKKM